MTGPDKFLALDESLRRLAEVDSRQEQIVELRVFAGMSIEEIAGLLKISPATVKRDWTMAKAWLLIGDGKPERLDRESRALGKHEGDVVLVVEMDREARLASCAMPAATDQSLLAEAEALIESQETNARTLRENRKIVEPLAMDGRGRNGLFRILVSTAPVESGHVDLHPCDHAWMQRVAVKK